MRLLRLFGALNEGAAAGIEFLFYRHKMLKYAVESYTGTQVYQSYPTHLPAPTHLQSVQIKLVLGHSAQWRKKPTTEGYTHDWTVLVRGEDGQDIRHFVEKVVFFLHESFPKPRRGRCVCSMMEEEEREGG